jgi:lipoate synthase
LTEGHNVDVDSAELAQSIPELLIRLAETEHERSQRALDMGFLYCASGPLVRSSYKAGEAFIENVLKNS